MLALRTGWTPQVIGGDAPDGISDRFRRAAHLALFAERVAPLYNEALQASVRTAPMDAAVEYRTAVARARIEAIEELAKMRRLLEMVDG